MGVLNITLLQKALKINSVTKEAKSKIIKNCNIFIYLFINSYELLYNIKNGIIKEKILKT